MAINLHGWQVAVQPGGQLAVVCRVSGIPASYKHSSPCKATDRKCMGIVGIRSLQRLLQSFAPSRAQPTLCGKFNQLLSAQQSAA